MNKIDFKYNGEDIVFEPITGKDKILQDITTLFKTDLGENRFQPNYGVPIYGVFHNRDEFTFEQVILRIKRSIEGVDGVASATLKNGGVEDGLQRKKVLLDFEIKTNEGDTIQFPLTLE